MKIAVEIDLEPDEIPMAAELLAVLQRITTHIRPADGTRIYERVFKQVIAGYGRSSTWRPARHHPAPNSFPQCILLMATILNQAHPAR